MIRKIILGLAIAACLAAPTEAQKPYGVATSNLKKVLVYYFGFGASDHQNTSTYAEYFKTLGTQHGFTADVGQSQSVFTTANLANYQAIVLFSAYNFGTNMTAVQRKAVEDWYKGNRGIACFHQCVKNQWGGNYPNWYDSLMGTQYQTWAGFGTGPVWVNSAVVGSELASGLSSTGTVTPYAADYTLSWDDEWYTYTTMPANTLGGKTRLMWTTKRSVHNFGASFVTPGEIQPIAWAREVGGGRYTLNSVFHRDVARTSTNPALRQFIDGALVGALRYIAGYTGCTDSTKVGYNPKATHMDIKACDELGIRILGTEYSREVSLRDLKVSLTMPGAHSVELFGSNGIKVKSYNGTGPRDYSFENMRATGIHFLRVKAGTQVVTKRIFLY